MSTKIEESIVATNGSTITKATINIKKVKTQYLLIGFVLGVLSSLLANFIWEYFIK